MGYGLLASCECGLHEELLVDCGMSMICYVPGACDDCKRAVSVVEEESSCFHCNGFNVRAFPEVMDDFEYGGELVPHLRDQAAGNDENGASPRRYVCPACGNKALKFVGGLMRVLWD